MALADSLARLGTTALLVAHQRLELVSLDVEEELLHTSRLLAGAMVAALLASLAMASAAAFIVVLLWDVARLAALGGVTLAFAGAAALVAWRVSLALAAKPRFLAATLEELRKDREALAGESA